MLTEAYQREACELIFGKGVWPDTASVNRHYGGRTPAVSNVFFSHGVEDPWQHAGVRQSLSATAPARVAECAGCSHCVDLRHITDDDPPQLKALRAELAQHVRWWLEEAAALMRPRAAVGSVVDAAVDAVPWRGSLQEVAAPY